MTEKHKHKQKKSIDNNSNTEVKGNDGENSHQHQHETSTAKATPEPIATPRQRLGLATILASLALIIAIVAGVEATVFWLHSKQAQTQTASSFAQLKATTQQNQEQLQSLNTQFATTQSTLSEQQQQLRNTSLSLQALIKKKNATTSDWKLLEANHLLRLADITLRFNRDVAGAIALLQNADKQIKSLHDASLLDIRTSIASNIMALKTLPKVDIADIITRLNAIKDQISNLPLKILTRTLTSDKKIENLASKISLTNQDSMQNGWRKTWEESLNVLKNMVVIRHHEKPVAPLISPKQQTYLTENLILMLEQAQWAAVHHKQVIYDFSLNQAIDWIKQYYQLEASETSAVLKELISLENIKLSHPLPDISATQTQLQQIIMQHTVEALSSEQEQKQENNQ